MSPLDHRRRQTGLWLPLWRIFSLSLGLCLSYLSHPLPALAASDKPVTTNTVTAQQTRLPTLFYSPAERHKLQAQRPTQASASTQLSSSAEGAGNEITPRLLWLNGRLKRSQGGHSVWLNQQMLPTANLDAALSKQLANLQLRPGELVDMTTQHKQDLLPPGSLTVHRRP